MWVVVVCALFCNALWGSAFPCIKLGSEWSGIVTTGDKIFYAGLRFMLAGIMVIAANSIGHGKLSVPKDRGDMARVLKLSMFQTVLQYLFFYIGLSNTSGVKASIVEGSNVFVAIVIAALIPALGRKNREKTMSGAEQCEMHVDSRERLSIRILAGCLIGFAGVVAVNLTPEGIDSGFRFFGEGFIFISTIAYGVSTVLIKRYAVGSDTVLLSGWQFFTGGIILTVIGYLLQGRIGTVNTQGVIMLIYLAVVSAAAYTLWGILLKYNPVSRIAVFGFFNPVFGVIMSAFLLGEQDMLSVRCLAALLLVCVGIYLVNSRPKANG